MLGRSSSSIQSVRGCGFIPRVEASPVSPELLIWLGAGGTDGFATEEWPPLRDPAASLDCGELRDRRRRVFSPTWIRHGRFQRISRTATFARDDEGDRKG